MTASQGRPLLLAKVDFPEVIRACTGRGLGGAGNAVPLASPRKRLRSCILLLCPGDQSQGPGAGNPVSCHFRSGRILTRTQDRGPVITEALCCSGPQPQPGTSYPVEQGEEEEAVGRLGEAWSCFPSLPAFQKFSAEGQLIQGLESVGH